MRANSTMPRLRATFLSSKEFAAKFDAFQKGRNKKQKSDRTLIHLHIPKTAGSSLTEVLMPNRKNGKRLTIGDGGLQKLKDLSSQQRREIKFLFGHLSHGVAQFFSQDYTYVCVLRRPGDRLLSYYRYLYRKDGHPSQQIVGGKNMSFGKFLEWVSKQKKGHFGEVNNGQIRRLAGLGMSANFGEEAQLLPLALSNLLAPDMIYGLTEHFEDFQARLHAQDYIDELITVKQNVAPQPACLDEEIDRLTRKQKSLFDAFTHWDDILYSLGEKNYFLGERKAS